MLLASGFPLLGAGGSAARAEVPKRAIELRDALAQTIQFPGVDDPKATLADVLDMLSKQAGKAKGVLAFDINEKAFTEDGIEGVQKTLVADPNPLPPMNAALSVVLKKVLSRVPTSSGATYVVRPDTVEITTNSTLAREFYGRDARMPLSPLVIASFEESSLADALKELARQTGRSIVLDTRAARENKATVTADLMNVPLDDAAFLLADMAGLQLVHVGRVLYVTTAAKAKAIEKERERRATSPIDDTVP